MLKPTHLPSHLHCLRLSWEILGIVVGVGGNWEGCTDVYIYCIYMESVYLFGSLSVHNTFVYICDLMYSHVSFSSPYFIGI